MTEPRWTYPPEFSDVLLGLGLRPTAETPPRVVREAVNDLYRLELQRLRNQLRAGNLAKADYVPRIVALRKKYWPLTLQLPAWEKICGFGAKPRRS